MILLMKSSPRHPVPLVVASSINAVIVMNLVTTSKSFFLLSLFHVRHARIYIFYTYLFHLRVISTYISLYLPVCHRAWFSSDTARATAFAA